MCIALGLLLVFSWSSPLRVTQAPSLRTTRQDPKDKLELKENVDSGVYVKDLTTSVVKSAMEIDHVMQVSIVDGLVAACTPT